jgi:CDP-diacylglycerol--glycerol-3-phosphate 3-phosphatidyltransferase
VTGSIVSPGLRARVRDLATPIAMILGAVGLTPNALTMIGFVGTAVAAVAAVYQQWVLAGVLLIVFGIFDLFDGALARATDRVSKLGAFLDSTFDRWGEGLVYVGIAWGCIEAGFQNGAVLAGAAMTSAFMVSYTRAKAESLGYAPGSGLAAVGLAPREVRLVILALGLIAAGIAGGVGPETVLTCPANVGGCLDAHVFGEGIPGGGNGILGWTLGIITVLATITTIQRILHVRAQAKEG